MTRHRSALAVPILGVAFAVILRGADTRSYVVDATRSQATIEVGKSGVFSFAAGHTHEVLAPKMTGQVVLDVADPARSSVDVIIDAAALRVTGKGEPANDVPKVQETMLGPQVLDVEEHPTITFVSTSMALTSRAGPTLDVMVTGRLTIRDIAREIRVPVTVHMEGRTLVATGHFPVKQTEFEMKPVSVAGVVSVKDTVNISFTIVGH